VMKAENYREFGQEAGIDLNIEHGEEDFMVKADNPILSEINIARIKGQDLKTYYNSSNIDIEWYHFEYVERAYRHYKESRGLIDFTDMLERLVYEPGKLPALEAVIIDEAQDLNLAQHRMIDLLLAQGDVHKWVAVGDKRQAIYGFTGSYAQSFDLFKEKGTVYELPLDVCYRCPQAVIREANKVYNVIDHFKEYDGIVDTVTDIGFIKNSSMVICRNSGPLIVLYFQLLAQRRKVYIKGEDILTGLTRFLDPYSYKTVAQTISKIESEIIELGSKQNKSDEQRYKLYRFRDNLANLKLLQEHFCTASDKIATLIERFKVMFEESSDPEAITLCTIHKSKGLEADVVYILNENLIPSKFAKSPSQLEQEQNLKYVARTRAKEELYYLNLDI